MSLFRPLRLYGVLLASLGVVIAVALFTPVADDALDCSKDIHSSSILKISYQISYTQLL